MQYRVMQQRTSAAFLLSQLQHTLDHTRHR